MPQRMLFILTLFILTPFFLMVTPTTAADSDPSLVSDAAVMMDAETGDILYSKKAEESMYPASLTKIATAVYAIDKADLDDEVTVTGNATRTDGSRVYLEEGEQVRLRKLLQGLLINSGNDAAVAIAEHMEGSTEQFASELNDYLQNRIGVQHTHFENPHGLFAKDHVTTAQDLAKITKYAVQHDVFRDIFETEELDWHGESWDTTLFTHHKLMRDPNNDYVTGGKTGFVDESGHTLATTAEKDDLSLIVITLNAPLESDAYDDTMKLLDYGFDHFEQATIDKGTTFKADDDEYKANNNLTYTYNTDEEVRQHVTDVGELEISQPDGALDTSFPLKKPDTRKSSRAATGSNVQHSSKGPSLMLVIPAAAIFIVLTGIAYRRRRKRQDRFFT